MIQEEEEESSKDDDEKDEEPSSEESEQEEQKQNMQQEITRKYVDETFMKDTGENSSWLTQLLTMTEDEFDRLLQNIRDTWVFLQFIYVKLVW